MAAVRLPRIVRPKRLSEEVGRALEACIRRGDFVPGARLPTEVSLAAQFAVSRAVVREAIARLKADGLVETRQGAGAFVAQRLGAAVFRLDGDVPAELLRDEDVFELRMIIELAAAERAALRRSDADLERIGAALAAMDAALGGAAGGVAADDAFHCAIAAASGNPLIGRFVAFVSSEFSASRQPTWDQAGRSSGLAEAAQQEHRALFEAIRDGRSAAARQAAERHLHGTAARLGLELTVRQDRAAAVNDEGHEHG